MDNSHDRLNDKPVPFDKKPVRIFGMRWTGTKESAERIMHWVTNGQGVAEYTPHMDAYDDGTQGCPMSPATLTIVTLEGRMNVTAGDIVIKGIEGEFYPCKPTIFWNSYDVVL